jgi:hypothetical protein
MTDQIANPDPEDAESDIQHLASEDPGRPAADDTEGHGVRDGLVDDDGDTDGHMSRI